MSNARWQSKTQQLRALKKGMEHKPENTFIALYKTPFCILPAVLVLASQQLHGRTKEGQLKPVTA